MNSECCGPPPFGRPSISLPSTPSLVDSPLFPPPPRASSPRSFLPVRSRASYPFTLPPPPHQIIPPVPVLCLENRQVLEPEVYAEAYEMLRQKWECREHEMIQAHEPIKKRQRSRGTSPIAPWPSRRRSIIDSSEEGKDEQETEETAHLENGPRRLKRSKPSRDNLVTFFDNPPPASSTCFDEDGFRKPSLPTPGRSRSLSPRGTASSSSGPASMPLISRKRSVSQPCHSPPLPRSTSISQSRLDQLAAAATASSFPASRSAPQLAQLVPSPSARSAALLNVVQSFEAVLACRAEGWRRLANRKSSWTGPLAPSPSQI
ncbi:uncharacterized protein JCM15063_002132 [Sporobolomyces koalae]|uniref:uncharacterized protein n=1 Tax=Sporobolomyces koalae TaxID=500713 RepID=UPI0031821720